MKKIISVLSAIILTVPLTVLVEQKPAKAWMDFCNETGDRITVAIAWYEADDWQSAGWYELRDNSCRRHWPHELNGSKAFYFKALDRSGNDITPSPKTGFCTKSSGSFHYAKSAVEDFCGSNNTTFRNYQLFETSGRNFTFKLR
jgi:uncharacterized membrane protein